jgi:hypothetical protein
MLNVILRIAQLNLQIAWCRRGPQDLPAVGILLPLSIAAYVLLSLAVGAFVPQLHGGWVIAVFLDTAFLAGWYWLLLAMAGRRERYLQTASAVFGLQTLLAAPSIAELWFSQQHPADRVPDLVLMLLLTIWTLTATSHIVQAALQRSRTMCWILALMQVLTESMLLSGLYPGT